jgi:hypothetical protein
VAPPKSVLQSVSSQLVQRLAAGVADVAALPASSSSAMSPAGGSSSSLAASGRAVPAMFEDALSDNGFARSLVLIDEQDALHKVLSASEDSARSEAAARQQTAAQIAESAEMALAAEQEVRQETARLEQQASALSLSMVSVIRGGHCLPESVLRVLRDAGRFDVSSVNHCREVVAAELLGQRFGVYFRQHLESKCSEDDFRREVALWADKGSWKSPILPVVLLAIPNALQLMVLLVRSRPPHVSVLAPTASHVGVRTVVALGHESVPNRNHYCPLVPQSEAARTALKEIVATLAAESAAFNPVFVCLAFGCFPLLTSHSMAGPLYCAACSLAGCAVFL